MLLEGGIGALYITGFAAFQLYALVPYPVAFGFMVAVTLLASSLSVRQNGAPLSLIGSLGVLGTPFILCNGSESLAGLVLYACLILAGTGAIYFYKGWVSLLGVSFTGGWMVFLIGLASGAEGFHTALVDIGVMALAFGVSPRVVPRFMDRVYRIVAHAALLAFLWRELSVLPGGDAYVTIAWGLYAVGLFVAGLRLDNVALVRCGMATFFLVVGKLFLVDLAQVDTVWRVLLFLGFGGLFLALSYYLRSLWRPGTRDQ